MNLAHANTPQIDASRTVDNARKLVEMMRGCYCSLDPADRAEVLKLARALRTLLDKSGMTLKEVGCSAAEINDIIVATPGRTESVSSFGFLQEQMADETAELAVEIDSDLLEEDEPEKEEISRVRRKPEGHLSLICGSTREPHVRADVAALLRDFSDAQLTEMFDLIRLAG